MASNDAPISQAVDNAKNAKPGDAAASKRILDDIYDPQKRVLADPKDLKIDYKFSSKLLHEEGLLPELTIFGDCADVHGSELPNNPHSPISKDNLGRIEEVKNADGSTTTVEYDGLDRSPNKVTLTFGDGTTETYERTGHNWSQTRQTPGGEPVVNANVDAVDISESGDVTVTDGSVTQIHHQNGSVDVTAQNGEDGPKTRSHYQYDASGQIMSATRINPDGTTDTFSKNRLSDQWEMKTYGANGQSTDKAPISGLTVNPDGGIVYDSGATHVVVEGYGATHITEATTYGSYEQSFDPSGQLTTIVRTDIASGTTELITTVNGEHPCLLVYNTSSPDGYSTPSVTVNPDGSYSYVNDQGFKIDRPADFSPESLKQVPNNPAIAEVAKDNGVDVTRTVADGKFVYQYSVDVNGDTISLFSSNGDAKADAAKLLELRDEKLAEVEQQNNVNFGRDGESIAVDGEQVPLRTPTLGQIYGGEYSLQRSAPDVVTKNGKPLEIDILARQGSNPNKGGFADGSRVVLEPNGGDDTPDQVLKVFMHELAHNGQFRLYGDDKTYEATYAAQLGFVKADDTWLLVTKDGRYYKSIPGKGGVGSSSWARTDKEGNLLDANGNLSFIPETITNEEAADLALVPPATGYFPNPAEAGAEATSMFRSGEDSRAKFLSENPDAYAAIKKLDQLDINKTYGLDEHGEPKFIRNSDGLIVPNTPENRKAVQQFEDSVTSDHLGSLGEIFGGLNNSGPKINPKDLSSLHSQADMDYAPALSAVA